MQLWARAFLEQARVSAEDTLPLSHRTDWAHGHATATGVELLFWVPSPSSPNALLPQQYI